jgi:hypothetical protein
MIISMSVSTIRIISILMSFNKASTAQINLAPGQTISQVRCYR